MTATRHEAARPAWEYTDYGVPTSVTTPIHRGLAMRLSDEDAEYIHDPDRHPGQRAKRVLDLAASQGHLGRHWTADQQVAAHVGQVSAHHLCGEPGHVLRAVLHAAPPRDEHIERDPRNLHEMDVVGQATEREVPLKSGAPVRVTGVSWQDARSSISRHGEFHAGSGGGIDHVAVHRFTPDKRVFTHTDGLDHRLFDGERLRPEVRSYILGTITAWWAGEYRDWSKWARIFFAGSEASEWTSTTLEGNGDLDILMGVDYDGCRTANPQLAALTDQQITDRMNVGFRPHNGPVMLTIDGIEYGPFDRTSFVNPTSYDIQRIKPYAAYDVGADEWVVKPPHLPHWSLSELPKPVQQVLRAADSYARQVLKLPEPERTQQGAALFEAWHTDRSRAFSERGEGWWDIANLREKWGDQQGWWAQLVDCAHRAKQGLDAAPADWSNIPTGYVTAASRSETGAYPSRVSHHELERLVPGYDPEEHAFSDPSLRRATFSYVDRFPVRSLPEAEPTSPEFYAHSVDHDSEQERQDHLDEMRELGDAIKQNPHSVPPIVVDHTRGFPLLDGSHRSGLALHHGVEHLPAYVREVAKGTGRISMMEAPREGALPHSPGRLFYRVHPVKRGWSQENASSQPFGGGGAYGDEGEELPREHGYSAFDNPHDLGRYLNAMDWHRQLPRLPRTEEDREEGRPGRIDPHQVRVVQFPGEIVGHGHDGEHLARPHARADRQEMDYETFWHRLRQTPHPDVPYHWHKAPYERTPEWAEGNGHDCDPGGQGGCHNDYSEEAHEEGLQPTHHWASKEATAQIWITPQIVMGSAAGLNHARQVNSASEAVAAIQQGLTAVLPLGAWFPVRQVLLGLGMSLLDVTQRLKQFGAPTSVTG